MLLDAGRVALEPLGAVGRAAFAWLTDQIATTHCSNNYFRYHVHQRDRCVRDRSVRVGRIERRGIHSRGVFTGCATAVGVSQCRIAADRHVPACGCILHGVDIAATR